MRDGVSTSAVFTLDEAAFTTMRNAASALSLAL
jgi:hypothetical protein